MERGWNGDGTYIHKTLHSSASVARRRACSVLCVCLLRFEVKLLIRKWLLLLLLLLLVMVVVVDETAAVVRWQ